MSKIPDYWRPSGPRVIGSIHFSKVPAIISARIETALETSTRSSAGSVSEEIETEKKRRKLRKRLKVLHLPSRDEFEQSVLVGRVKTPEIKIDGETDRFYLTGVGVPGREERHNVNRNVDDADDKISKQIWTEVMEKDDLVVAYTEVTRHDVHNAKMTVEDLEPVIKKGLMTFFETPPSHLIGLVLSFPNFSSDDLRNVAHYALHEKGA
jgi:hypothetical protein